ncbi:MAG: hypothetical protein JJU00_10605 [Opitutales bacterium]|nr:hypothetical protein [Opitutales bacterium]
MNKFPAASTAVLSVCLFSVSAQLAATPPTDNPVATHYGAETYAWTDEIHWAEVFDVTDFGAVPDDGEVDQAAIEAAIDAAYSAGGGVVYFPPGVYHLSDDLALRTGVVLRGAAPPQPQAEPSHERGDGTPLAAPAQRDDFLPPSRLQFPRYEFDPFLPEGQPNDTAFKVITVADEATTANWGLIHLDIDHARIRNYVDVWPSGPFEIADRALGIDPELAVRNIVIYGIRGNRMAAPDPRVPGGSQHGWQRWPARGSNNIGILAYENVLIANNRLNDAITDDFSMPGYVLSSGAEPNKPVDDEIAFRYTDVYGINVNRVIQNPPGPAPSSLTPDAFPEAFRKGIVVRDNWMLTTKRVAMHLTGQDLVVLDNVKVDDPAKWTALNPEGLGQAAGSNTNENRGLDFSGFNVTVEGNDFDVHSHLVYLSDRTINGSVDGEAILNQAHSTAIVRGAWIENNYVKGYIGIYKTGDSEDIVVRRNRIRPGSFTRQNIYENIYVVADMNVTENTYLRNVLIEDNWLNANDDVTVYGTGGVDNVTVRNHDAGTRLRHTEGVELENNAFTELQPKPQDYPYNPRPTVVLSGLSDRSVVDVGTGVTIAAETDHAGPVKRVEFWSNGIKLGESTEAPFELVMDGLEVGVRHNVYAKAVAAGPDGEDGRWNWSMRSIAFDVAESGAVPVPRVPGTFLVIAADGARRVSLPTEDGFRYHLWRSTDLEDWGSAPVISVDGDGTVRTLDDDDPPLQAGDSLFYRIGIESL